MATAAMNPKSSDKLMAISVGRLDEILKRLKEELPHTAKYLESENFEVIRLRHRLATKLQLAESRRRAAFFRNWAELEMINHSNEKTFVSKTPLSKLRPTAIPDLQLKRSARGTYLLARAIENLYASDMTWNTIIEDHLGNTVSLRLRNFLIDEIFSIGDVIVIKEPYLGGNSAIHCECPTNIMVLRPFHPLHHLGKEIKWTHNIIVEDPLKFEPLPATALEWKARGDFFIEENRDLGYDVIIIEARDAYFLGLAACLNPDDSTSKLIQQDLFRVQLRLEYLEWVVEHAEKFLQKFQEEKDAYLSLGAAYYCLRKYDKATEVYEKLCEEFPQDEVGKKELGRAKERVHELTTGEFYFEKLREISMEKPLEKLDCADYGAFVKIAKISGKGRGLISTKDVKKGEVVIVSKALVAVWDENRTQDRKYETAVSRLEIVAKVSRIITKNPNTFGSQVYALWTKKKSSLPDQLFCDPALKIEPISDVGLIENIFVGNNFTITESISGEVRRKGSGLFLVPSYLNFSCTPNLNYEFYNDVMVIRAAENIKDGTELTISFPFG